MRRRRQQFYDKWENSRLVDAVFMWGINRLATEPIEAVVPSAAEGKQNA